MVDGGEVGCCISRDGEDVKWSIKNIPRLLLDVVLGSSCILLCMYSSRYRTR